MDRVYSHFKDTLEFGHERLINSKESDFLTTWMDVEDNSMVRISHRKESYCRQVVKLMHGPSAALA